MGITERSHLLFLQWRNEIFRHKKLIFISLGFLILSTIFMYISGTYIEKVADASVSDLILDHVPVVDLSFIFVYSIIFIISIMFLYPLFFHVSYFHIVLSQVSLLIMTRNFFTILTHLKAPPEAIMIQFPLRSLDLLNFNNGLFFSGHTAIPFLGFLIFRKHNRIVAYFMLVSSIVLGATVLLMHVHYSIDVFAALFIAYGSYKLGDRLFKRIDHSKNDN